MKPAYRLGLLAGAAGLLLVAGCASPIEQRSTRFLDAGDRQQRDIVVSQAVQVTPANGYPRVIKAGSRWRHQGSVPEGEVYKIENDVFMVEGANMHEAYSVINDDQLVGFYLPVKHTFAPLRKPVHLSLQNQ